MIAEHSMNTRHNFNWKTVQILEQKTNYYKRLIAETLHIKLNKDSLNIMQDTELLDRAYLPLLKKLNT